MNLEFKLLNSSFSNASFDSGHLPEISFQSFEEFSVSNKLSTLIDGSFQKITFFELNFWLKQSLDFRSHFRPSIDAPLGKTFAVKNVWKILLHENCQALLKNVVGWVIETFKIKRPTKFSGDHRGQQCLHWTQRPFF